VALPGQHRAQQGRKVLRRVFEVGVADDHVRTGGEGARGAHRSTLAAVARVGPQREAGVVEPGERLGGAVPAAVVDDDQLELARILHVQDPLDDRGHGRGLVVHRHEDGQFHRAPFRGGFAHPPHSGAVRK
jgi:hypothetical protein